MKKRMDSMQALRFLACLCIFAHHCYITEVVYWGVSVFFVMSGFLMCCGYYDRYSASLSPAVSLRFSLKKLWKLYPLHVLTMLPILALDIYMRPSTGMTNGFIIAETAANLLLVQAWLPEYAFSLNGVAWYLSVSVLLYFLFPYILACIRTYRSRRMAFAACAVLFAVQIGLCALAAPLGRALYGEDYSSFAFWFGYIFPPVRAVDFAVGCNLGYIFITRRPGACESRRASVALELACAVLLALAVWIFKSGHSFLALREFRSAVLFLPFAAAAVYLFAVGKGLIPRLLTNRVTVFLGDMSAWFYLIHQDVVRPGYMLLDRMGLTLSQCKPILFFVCGALALAASALWARIDAGARKKMG